MSQTQLRTLRPALCLFLLCFAPRTLAASKSPCSTALNLASNAQVQGLFDLNVAQQYEEESHWKEAEQEYLQAGRVGPPCVQIEAMDGIKRISAHRASGEESFEFELGKFYENAHDWKDAEQHYAAAATDGTQFQRDSALKNVARVHAHLWLQDEVDSLDRRLGYVARALAIIYLVVLAFRLAKIRNGLRVMPFEVSNEEADKRINFALSAARDELPSLLSPVLTTMNANVVDTLPLIVLPGLENEFPDPAEDLEFGEIKLSLANWIRVVNRSAVRVSGRWQVGQKVGTAQARILRRAFLMSYKQRFVVLRQVKSEGSDAQDRDLRFLGYDVLVKAIFARRYVS